MKPQISSSGPTRNGIWLSSKELRCEEASDRDAFIANEARQVTAIATHGEPGASAELMGRLPNLKIFSVCGVGYDAVNLDACRERGIRVTNTPDVLTNNVAGLGVAMMLCQSRGRIGAEQW